MGPEHRLGTAPRPGTRPRPCTRLVHRSITSHRMRIPGYTVTALATADPAPACNACMRQPPWPCAHSSAAWSAGTVHSQHPSLFPLLFACSIFQPDRTHLKSMNAIRLCSSPTRAAFRRSSRWQRTQAVSSCLVCPIVLCRCLEAQPRPRRPCHFARSTSLGHFVDGDALTESVGRICPRSPKKSYSENLYSAIDRRAESTACVAS